MTNIKEVFDNIELETFEKIALLFLKNGFARPTPYAIGYPIFSGSVRTLQILQYFPRSRQLIVKFEDTHLVLKGGKVALIRKILKSFSLRI